MKVATPERTTATQGWVLYDGECSLCLRGVRHFRVLLHRNGFELAALQKNWVCERFDFDPRRRPDEMIVLLPDGRAIGGADGIVQIARRVWWAWPLFALAQLPGTMVLLRMFYRHIAARRSCAAGACVVPRQRHAADWLPLVVLPVLVLAARNIFPAWVFMWLLAGALFYGCKWLTWRRGLRKT